MLKDLRIQVSDPITLKCDNTSAINISKNPLMHCRTKHIAIRYHFLKEKVVEGEFKLEYVPTIEQWLIFSPNCYLKTSLCTYVRN